MTPAQRERPEGDTRDDAARARDAAAGVRDGVGQDRDVVATSRDRQGLLRDSAALQRDLDADERDRAAERRDEIALATEIVGTRNRLQVLLEQHAALRMGAASDRRLSRLDRSAEAGGRLDAGLDRSDALADRGAAAQERNAARVDRGVADGDREASAVDRAVAARDHLTGAYSRRAGFAELVRDISRARRTEEPLVVAFLDVDGLKRVNDSLGHIAGDRLLRRVADACSAAMRPHDLVIRYGGDEFICVMSGLSQAHAQARLIGINVQLSRGLDSGSVSFGLAQLRPEDSADVLVARADLSLARRRRQRGSGLHR